MKYLFCTLAIYFIGCVIANDFVPNGETTYFYENFKDLKQWTVSKNPDFTGIWKLQANSLSSHDGRLSLEMRSKNAKHAISSSFEEPIYWKDGDLIIQYEVRLQNGLDCGGAYIKLLREKFDPIEFGNETPYSIMFGPDKCGSDNKVHVILQYPLASGKFEEKHLRTKPRASIDDRTHLYTLILSANGEFEVLIDGSSNKKGSLLRDMEPSITPARMISDPSDIKPKDWVDSPTMPDPDDEMPIDYPEEMIIDPDATMPEDWDVEEDGEWTAPSIPNPEFKGQWQPKHIPNPLYKGEWKAKQIENPEYIEVEFTSLGPFYGVGYELFTLNEGIAFNNIYIGKSRKDMEALISDFRIRQREENVPSEKELEQEFDIERKFKEEEDDDEIEIPENDEGQYEMRNMQTEEDFFQVNEIDQETRDRIHMEVDNEFSPIRDEL
eukprot:TRINITY_DN3311_c2_g1_i13.p1 TRINITY_DN3311_c2_g1~~TRINITY_DN3311_c2_g1_i13.p1  ORF type:complete len:438 (+),score=153.28 TRINITY_DN3311_c2_g1_i13:33-1346(+)